SRRIADGSTHACIGLSQHCQRNEQHQRCRQHLFFRHMSPPTQKEGHQRAVNFIQSAASPADPFGIPEKSSDNVLPLAGNVKLETRMEECSFEGMTTTTKTQRHQEKRPFLVSLCLC